MLLNSDIQPETVPLVVRHYSATLQETFTYAQLGTTAIESALASEMSATPLRVALIYTVPLLFSLRDQLAFEWLSSSPLFEPLGLAGKIRQLPTLTQLQALIDSRRKDSARWEEIRPEWRGNADLLKQLEDSTLGLEGVRQFREQVVHHGVPPTLTTLENVSESLFLPPRLPEDSVLASHVLSGWKKLWEWMHSHTSVSNSVL